MRALVVALLTAAAVFFLDAWIVMLALGGLHRADARIPALGYGAAALALVVVRYVAGSRAAARNG